MTREQLIEKSKAYFDMVHNNYKGILSRSEVAKFATDFYLSLHPESEQSVTEPLIEQPFSIAPSEPVKEVTDSNQLKLPTNHEVLQLATGYVETTENPNANASSYAAGYYRGYKDAINAERQRIKDEVSKLTMYGDERINFLKFIDNK